MVISLFYNRVDSYVCLPTTTWADDGNLFASWDSEADIFQDGSVRMITKGYVLKFDLSSFKL